MVDHAADWGLRVRRPELVERYRLEGWWTDQSLGDVVAGGLRAAAQCTFRVHSTVHPWSGTLGEVDRAARSLARTLQARGVGAGDTVMVQLPNWVEAAIAFWAAAYLGAVVVPVVHFYGAKEAAYILDVTRPKVVVTADRFRHSDYLTIYEGLLAERPGPLWLVAGGDAALPARASTFVSMLDAAPLTAPVAVDPDWPALVAFTSGTTSDPKGVVHSHRTIGFETRQLGERTPTAGPPPMTVAPVGHFIGMVGAFLGPLFSPRPVHLVDVFEPGAVLRLMLDEGITMSGGATYFLTSLLDHPDFSTDHLALMPYVGLGGSVVPAAVTERAERDWASRPSARTAAASTRRPPAVRSATHRPSACTPTGDRCPASICGWTKTARS